MPRVLSFLSFTIFYLLLFSSVFFFSLCRELLPCFVLCYPNILLVLCWWWYRIFLHYIHVGDNSQLCNKNNETNLFNQICNFKNAIHILYSFVVCDLPLTLMCLVLFSIAKVVLFLYSVGVKTVFSGYKLFNGGVKTIGFTTTGVIIAPVFAWFDLLDEVMFSGWFLSYRIVICPLYTTKKP